MSVIWLTGLSGSGKSTIAEKLSNHIDSQVVDGDVIRRNLSSDLRHGVIDKKEHYNRVVNFIKSNLKKSDYTIVALVSANKTDRGWIKDLFEKDQISFFEIYVKASLQTCEKRDPKGLYAKYRKGEDIKLAGLTEEYQEPDFPFLICNTENETVEVCVQRILEVIKNTL